MSWKGSHKDNQNPAPGPAQNNPKNYMMCLRAQPGTSWTLSGKKPSQVKTILSCNQQNL